MMSFELVHDSVRSVLREVHVLICLHAAQKIPFLSPEMQSRDIMAGNLSPRHCRMPLALCRAEPPIMLQENQALCGLRSIQYSSKE